MNRENELLLVTDSEMIFIRPGFLRTVSTIQNHFLTKHSEIYSLVKPKFDTIFSLLIKPEDYFVPAATIKNVASFIVGEPAREM